MAQFVDIRFSNVPDSTTLTIPCSGGTGLAASDTISWDGGSTTQPITNLPTYTAPATGGPHTIDVKISVGNGFFTQLGGTETFMDSINYTGYLTWFLPNIYVNNNPSTNWGFGNNGANPGLTSISYAFKGCGFLQNALGREFPSEPPTSVTDYEGTFKGLTGNIGNIRYWNMNNAENTSRMFENSTYNRGIQGWVMNNVTDMSFMFANNSSFDQRIGGWTLTSGNLVNVEAMFKGATSFNNNDDATKLDTWNMSNVTNMKDMFNGAAAFDRSLSGWNTSNVTNMSGMFQGGIYNRSGLVNWDVSNVTDFSNMFRDNTDFNAGGDSGFNDWDTSSATTMSAMFQGATNFSNNITGWDVSNVTDMSSMFSGATAFNQPIGNWNTSSVTNMSSMFSGATAFDQYINRDTVNNYWDTTNVTNMSGMFQGATSFNQNITQWFTLSVTDMSVMFQNASAFDQPVRVWKVREDTLFTDMFDGASAMTLSYTGFPGYGSTPTIAFFNFTYPCFLEGSKIETNKGYVPVESLRNGDLVKTYKDGFKAVKYIGTRTITHLALTERIKDQLYVCKPSKFPEATEDLVITGCHSLLIPRHFRDEEEKNRVISVMNYVCLTDGIPRFPACVEDRTEVYPEKGTFHIYHFALDHDDYLMNYGVYANGILVESSSQRYMLEMSNMKLIGEVDK